jgi:RNA methyltransferase, TrmH family
MGLRLARVRAIESRSNPLIKELYALAKDAREVKVRQRTLIDGLHLIDAYQRNRGIPELLVVNTSGTENIEIEALLRKWPDIDVIRLPDSLFRDISGVITPTGILAMIPIPPSPTGSIQGSCVILDAVQDAGNVGTIMRTVAAAGIRNVVLGAGCASAWSPKVLRAAQGAHFGLRIREQVDIGCLIAEYPGKTVATVARGGTTVFDLDLSSDMAWIFGNEGSGVSDDLASLATVRATIPMAVDTESLNVAAAAAICVFEQFRQRCLTKVETGDA